MTKKRKQYTQEFKQEAVKLVTLHGYSAAQAGRSLGVEGNSVSRWVREHSSQSSEMQSAKDITADHKRIVELEKQVKRLEMEKDILKKATAFFAKENP